VCATDFGRNQGNKQTFANLRRDSANETFARRAIQSFGQPLAAIMA
jgi:hypothetical protein